MVSAPAKSSPFTREKSTQRRNGKNSFRESFPIVPTPTTLSKFFPLRPRMREKLQCSTPGAGCFRNIGLRSESPLSLISGQPAFCAGCPGVGEGRCLFVCLFIYFFVCAVRYINPVNSVNSTCSPQPLYAINLICIVYVYIWYAIYIYARYARYAMLQSISLYSLYLIYSSYERW